MEVEHSYNTSITHSGLQSFYYILKIRTEPMELREINEESGMTACRSKRRCRHERRPYVFR